MTSCSVPPLPLRHAPPPQRPLAPAHPYLPGDCLRSLPPSNPIRLAHLAATPARRLADGRSVPDAPAPDCAPLDPSLTSLVPDAISSPLPPTLAGLRIEPPLHALCRLRGIPMRLASLTPPPSSLAHASASTTASMPPPSAPDAACCRLLPSFPCCMLSEVHQEINGLEDMLGIEPLEKLLRFEPNKQVSCSIQLANDTDDKMAFSISQTGLSPYNIHPSIDIVWPRSKLSVSIALKPLKEAPPQKCCTEVFIVQSTRVDASLKAADITGDLFDEEPGRVVDKVEFILNLDVPTQSIN